MKKTRAPGGGRKPLTTAEPTVKVAITLLSSQVEAMKQLGGGNLSAGIRKAISMKEIKVGETNDLYLYAVKADGRYFPLTKKDLNFERPDAKIFYDSGIYPGISLDELPQYICDKARDAE